MVLQVGKQDFKITSDPKGPQREPTFGRVLRPQTLRRPRGDNAHFPDKKGPKN